MKQSIFDSLFPENRDPISPEDVINQVVASAKAQARSWGEGKLSEVPSHFEVAVNNRDWQEYFSKHTEQTQRRIAEIVAEKLSQGDYSMEGCPQVRLYRDNNPDAVGIIVRATFADSILPRDDQADSRNACVDEQLGKTEIKSVSAHGNKTVALSDCKDRNDQDAHSPMLGKTVALPSERLAHEEMSPSEYARALDNLIPETEVMADAGWQQKARLEGAEHTYEVAPGYRVGADREGSSTPAQILLPRESHAKTSREHGIFMLDATSWIFVNYGTNGTRVQRADGSKAKLEKNESCPIENGDVLFFGTEDGYRFVIQ